MNKWCYRLEDLGVTFYSWETKQGKLVDVWYKAPVSNASQISQVPVP